MPQPAMVSETLSPDTQLIWQEFSDRLRAFIGRRVGSKADAEDILQDVFLRIHQHAGGVDRADRLTSWLFQVTRNAIVDYYRSPVRREQLESGTAPEILDRSDIATPGTDVDLDAGQVRQELANCLRPMIEHLPPHYREAVALVDLNGLTQVLAAERLGLSVSGMKSRVQRGRRALRDTLVDCCPVQLDTSGRIVDYSGPGPTCTTCAGSGSVATVVEHYGNQQTRCCAPPAPG